MVIRLYAAIGPGKNKTNGLENKNIEKKNRRQALQAQNNISTTTRNEPQRIAFQVLDRLNTSPTNPEIGVNSDHQSTRIRTPRTGAREYRAARPGQWRCVASGHPTVGRHPHRLREEGRPRNRRLHSIRDTVHDLPRVQRLENTGWIKLDEGIGDVQYMVQHERRECWMKGKRSLLMKGLPGEKI